MAVGDAALSCQWRDDPTCHLTFPVTQCRHPTETQVTYLLWSQGREGQKLGVSRRSWPSRPITRWALPFEAASGSLSTDPGHGAGLTLHVFIPGSELSPEPTRMLTS